jgi:hypothetical protein
MLVPAVHRLEFDAGRVVLTLALADAPKALRELRLAADADFSTVSRRRRTRRCGRQRR